MNIWRKKMNSIPNVSYIGFIKMKMEKINHFIWDAMELDLEESSRH